MAKQKKPSPLTPLAWMLLGVMIIIAGALGLDVSDLYGQMKYAQSLTPTPLPAYGNVMLITPDPNAPTPAPVLRTGSTGEAVWKLQERLRDLGFYTGALDGQYGPGTQSAVFTFQQQHNLTADGIAGTATCSLLYSDQAHALIVTPTPAPTATPSPVPDVIPGLTSSGMPILVNRQNHLPDDYRTVELVNMRTYCDSAIVTIKGSEIEGERVAVDALMTMLQAAHRDGLKVWQVSAGYRSVAYQQKLFDDRVYQERKNGKSGSEARAIVRKTVADPGSSEHHLGLAFDMTVPGEQFSNTRQHIWLAQHCWEYGFILRYQLEKESITGFSYEPWHIRYVGTEHSLIMRDEQLCLEEYLAKYGY